MRMTKTDRVNCCWKLESDRGQFKTSLERPLKYNNVGFAEGNSLETPKCRTTFQTRVREENEGSQWSVQNPDLLAN
jgi:hypothetical protein